MGKPNFSDEFKRDAVAQITERGYPKAECWLSERDDQKPPFAVFTLITATDQSRPFTPVAINVRFLTKNCQLGARGDARQGVFIFWSLSGRFVNSRAVIR